MPLLAGRGFVDPACKVFNILVAGHERKADGKYSGHGYERGCMLFSGRRSMYTQEGPVEHWRNMTALSSVRHIWRLELLVEVCSSQSSPRVRRHCSRSVQVHVFQLLAMAGTPDVCRSL